MARSFTWSTWDSVLFLVFVALKESMKCSSVSISSACSAGGYELIYGFNFDSILKMVQTETQYLSMEIISTVWCEAH